MTDDRLWHEAEARWRTIVAERPDSRTCHRAPAILDPPRHRDVSRGRHGWTPGTGVSAALPRAQDRPRRAALSRRAPAGTNGRAAPVPARLRERSGGSRRGTGSRTRRRRPSVRPHRCGVAAGGVDGAQSGCHPRVVDASVARTRPGLAGRRARDQRFVHQLAHSCWSAMAGRSPSDDEQTLEHDVEAELARAGWNRGYCPTCGSWPVLSSLRRATRACCTARTARRRGERASTAAPYCGASNEQFRILAARRGTPGPVDRGVRRVRRAISRRSPADSSPPFPLLAIEDLATVDLDRAGDEAGICPAACFLRAAIRPECSSPPAFAGRGFEILVQAVAVRVHGHDGGKLTHA